LKVQDLRRRIRIAIRRGVAQYQVFVDEGSEFTEERYVIPSSVHGAIFA
jgi:hypothetical protein